jgi:hypothetical protein
MILAIPMQPAGQACPGNIDSATLRLVFPTHCVAVKVKLEWQLPCQLSRLLCALCSDVGGLGVTVRCSGIYFCTYLL